MANLRASTHRLRAALGAALVGVACASPPTDNHVQVDVHGTVTSGRSGAPIGGAQVQLGYFIDPYSPHHREVAGFSDTDIDGRYHITAPVASCSGLYLQVVAWGFFSGDFGPTIPISCEGGTHQVDIVLPPLATRVDAVPETLIVALGAEGALQVSFLYGDGTAGPGAEVVWQVGTIPYTVSSECGRIDPRAPFQGSYAYVSPSASPPSACGMAGAGSVLVVARPGNVTIESAVDSVTVLISPPR